LTLIERVDYDQQLFHIQKTDDRRPETA